MPILVGDTSGIAQGISTAGSALAQALERRAEYRLKSQQQKQQQDFVKSLLPKDQVTSVGDDSGAQLKNLDALENEILSMPITPENKEILKTLRSRRAALGQELSAGETESAKLAARRRSEKIDTLSEKAEASESTLQAVSQLESMIENRETGPNLKNTILNMTEGQTGIMGAINGFLTSVESQGFKSAQLQFFPQLKQLFGARITDRDLKTFMESMARFGTDPKAQKLALQTLKQYAQFDNKVGEYALSLMDENGMPVKGFERKLSKFRKEANEESKANFQSFSEELGFGGVQMLSPQGFLITVPKKEVKSAQAAGAKLKR